MKRKILKSVIILLSFFMTSCYGSWNIFYEGNNVDYRTPVMAVLNDLSDLSGSYNVLIITDTHFGYKNKEAPLAALYLWLDSVKGTAAAPAFAICLGDAVDTGAQGEYEEYLRFCEILKNLYGIRVVFNTCGNHDIYQSHWGNWQTNCYPHTSFYKFKTANFSWYSFDTASGTLGKNQLDIMKKDMETDPNPKIVFSHYPLSEYNLAFGLGDTTERNLLISTFLKNNVRCYFGGHNHYSHFSDMGLYDYCCPSFRFNEAWTVLHVNEGAGTAVAEFSK